MTMRIVFLKDHEGKKADTECFIDRPEAINLCEKGIAVTGNLYEKMQRKFAEKKEAAKEKAKAEKEKADEKKKAELLKSKEKVKAEKADSKKQNKAEKAIKK